MTSKPLRYAVIEVTNQCNLRCPHCASTSGIARENELSLSEIDTLLENIHDLGGEEITLIGGELFLREDWREICMKVVDSGMELIIISNGLLIQQEHREFLKSIKPKLIGISIDGARRDSYAQLRGIDRFDFVHELLHNLLKDGHENINAITTIMKSNLSEFDDFVELFDNTGITWQVQLASLGGERFAKDLFISRKEFAWLVDKMKDVFLNRSDTFKLRHMDDFGYFPIDPSLKFLHQTWNGCIAGRELIGVRSNGDILGCLSLGDDFIEANIRKEKLKDIWKSNDFFNQFRRKKEQLKGECKKCAFAEECQAGCSCIAYSATGSINSNPYCIRSIELEEILDSI